MITVHTVSISRTLTAPGVVHAQPDHLINVTSAMVGKLVSVLATVGQHVKKGQVIAQLDDRHIQEQLEQSTASVKTSQTNISQIEGNLKFAKENLDRQRKLFEAEVSAQKDVIAAENQVENLKSQLESAKSQTATAQSARDQIVTELGYTRIVTPIEGVISNRFLNVGNSVDPNTPIVQVVDLKNVVIDASVPADSLVHVKQGAAATITSVADSRITFGAKVMDVSPVIDAVSDTFKIILSCSNPQWQLKEGQSVTVTITTSIDRHVIVIPRAALVPDPDRPAAFMVYLFREGKAKRVPVERGESKDDSVEIKSGLKPGDKLLTKEVYGLPDGAEVEVDEALQTK